MSRLTSAGRILILLPLALLLAGLSTRAPAQGLRGTVLSGATPVSGAVVELIRAPDSAVVARVFSRADGSFQLPETATPEMWLRTRAIGYRPARTAIRAAVDGVLRPVTVQLVVVSLVLADLEVRAAGKACRREVGNHHQLAEVFDLVRTTSAVISHNLERPDLRFTAEVRFIDSLPRSFSDSTVFFPDYAMLDWPVRSPPLAQLQEVGFSRPKSGAEGVGRWFYGVDLQLLQSEWFTAGHCFWITAAPETEGSDAVLLRFEPAGKPKTVDVAGSLLVRTSDWSIRRLDYRHVNLPSWFPPGSSWGVITLERDSTGIWYPATWQLKSPVENDPGFGLMRPRLDGAHFATRRGRSAVIGISAVSGKVTGVHPVQR